MKKRIFIATVTIAFNLLLLVSSANAQPQHSITYNFWTFNDNYCPIISLDQDFNTFIGLTMGGSISMVGAIYHYIESFNGEVSHGYVCNNVLQQYYWNGSNWVLQVPWGGCFRVDGNRYHFKASTAGGDSATEETLTGEWFCLEIVDNNNVRLWRSNGCKALPVNEYWLSLDGGATWSRMKP